MQNFYQRTLIWQKETMLAAGSDITAIIHLYCKFLADQEIHLCRANVAPTTKAVMRREPQPSCR